MKILPSGFSFEEIVLDDQKFEYPEIIFSVKE